MLLVCLVGTLGVAASGSGSLDLHSGSSSARATWCVPVKPPPLANARLDQIVELRASLLPVVEALAGRRYAAGSVVPEVVWTDNSPEKLRSSRLNDGFWPGSFEIRTWALSRDDIVADAFAFTDPAQARRFFQEATSVRCHLKGQARTASRLPQARNLVWVNPDGPTQADVFLLRGSRVYRIGDVPARVPHESSGQQLSVLMVNALACTLPNADCSSRSRRANRAVAVAVAA